MEINITQKINNFREFKNYFGTQISDSFDLNLPVYALKLALSLGIKEIPKHTIICLPGIANPVTFHESQLIMLFANDPEEFIYQYAHELCHLLLGNFPKDLKWFSELLCCTCSNVLTEASNKCRDPLLPLKDNYNNFLAIKNILSDKPTAVYDHEERKFPTLICSYCFENPNFNFIDLLNQSVASKGNRDVLISLIDQLFHNIQATMKNNNNL